MSKHKDSIIIGVDFSINKPAATVWTPESSKWGEKYHFFGWPYSLREKITNIYKNAGIDIVERTDNKEKGIDVSDRMRYEVQNARYISEVMSDTLKPYLNSNTLIAYEGLSYGSSGDIVLQLGGYKYMLMHELSKFIPFKNMFTYSPPTVKKTAECSKRGLGKHCVIESFISSSNNNCLKKAIRADKDLFMKKGNKNFIDGLDDFVDSYYVLETLRVKEGL